MEKQRMLEIAKEEKQRFEALKRTCDTCIPDELIEWINSIIEMLEHPAKPEQRFRIWSNEHEAWWRPHFLGYTEDKEKAGIYTYAEIKKIYKKLPEATPKAKDFLVAVIEEEEYE